MRKSQRKVRKHVPEDILERLFRLWCKLSCPSLFNDIYSSQNVCFSGTPLDRPDNYIEYANFITYLSATKKHRKVAMRQLQDVNVIKRSMRQQRKYLPQKTCQSFSGI